jgi:hypothetical protein
MPELSFRDSVANRAAQLARSQRRASAAFQGIAMVDIAETHEARIGYLQALGMVCVRIIMEYQRASAAEEYYVSLKRQGDTALAREGMGHAEIPRRVFEEFYSFHAG